MITLDGWNFLQTFMVPEDDNGSTYRFWGKCLQVGFKQNVFHFMMNCINFGDPFNVPKTPWSSQYFRFNKYFGLWLISHKTLCYAYKHLAQAPLYNTVQSHKARMARPLCHHLANKMYLGFWLVLAFDLHYYKLHGANTTFISLLYCGKDWPPPGP